MESYLEGFGSAIPGFSLILRLALTLQLTLLTSLTLTLTSNLNCISPTDELSQKTRNGGPLPLEGEWQGQ